MKWYLYCNGAQTGPLTEEQLFQQGRDGLLKKTDLVWNETMPDWLSADRVPGLLDAHSGTMVAEKGPSDSKKNALLQAILQLNNAGPFNITRGSDTDVLISNEVVDSAWYSGKKKVTYTAQVLLKEQEMTVYYWEMLKEASSGLSLQAGFQKRKIKGAELFQKTREKGYSPDGGLVYDYQFDYGSLREAFKILAGQHGWKFKLVLVRGKTIY